MYIKLNEFYIFGISIKTNSFEVSIVIKIPLFRVLVTIGSSRSLPIIRFYELFDIHYLAITQQAVLSLAIHSFNF
jgi:hypothetical protein